MGLSQRQLTPELLDELPPGAPEAVHSRGDLRRLNALMGNVGCLVAGARAFRIPPPRSLAEVACGDGSVMVQLLKRTGWRPERLVLVDRQPVVTEATLTELRSLATQVEVVSADVFDWLHSLPETTAEAKETGLDLIVANLFLHHLENEGLCRLFALVASRSRGILGCEPRRSGFALLAARLVGLIGCNHVTRHDAVVSVQAGFRFGELAGLWPDGREWMVADRAEGLFSHCLMGRRISLVENTITDGAGTRIRIPI